MSYMKVTAVSNAVDLYSDDTLYLRLAREIASDLYDIETILKHNQIDRDRFEKIKADPRFVRLLESEIAAWNAANNTLERTKLKAGMLIEEWLPEANTRLHHDRELLSSKVELLKTLARIAGMGLEKAGIDGAGGEKFSVVINLGADQKLQFKHELPAKVIEAEVIKEN